MYITNWANKVEKIPPYLRDEAIPYSLPVVLLIEPDNTLTHEEVLEATVKTFSHFFNDEKVNTDNDWVEPLNHWMLGRIRKIARRAKPPQWNKIREQYLHFHHAHNNVEMLILPPHPIDQPLPEVKKLQVSGLDFPQTKQFSLQLETDKPILKLSVNPEVNMSTGKNIAQVAHATQLAIFSSTPDILTHWVENNYASRFVNFNELTQEDIVEVHDAGFTEVEAGTLTVKAALN